ncbi:MAG: DUF3365 domain-containing protein [Sandaracinus sp.]
MRTAALLALALAACGPPASPPATERAPTPATPVRAPTGAPTPDDLALAEANAAADELGRTLRARLLGALAEGGPAHAAEVCSTEAAALTAEVGARHGATVGRGSLRMRGAAPPPGWVEAWLDAQGERTAEGVTGFARVEDGHARVLRPIAIEAPCLTCHGASPAPEVAALLAERYPGDRATGYAVGALRGALYAEVPVR